LLFTKNFIYFLVVQFLFTLLENLLVSREANRIYSFLDMNKEMTLDINEKNTIKRNIKALMFHKIGSVVLSGTDNLVISKYVGILAVGIYSNYLLITNSLNMIYGLIFSH
jgi:hypothetical protein